jgi:alpha-D-ribose 1-methylphosphonate 5-triphosphate synthase subunit PhnH
MAGTAAIALALFDHDTPVWLDAGMAASDVEAWLTFHTGAPLTVDSLACAFAIIGDGAALPALDRFSFGTSEYPDRSATLVIQVESLTAGPPVILRGPGIDGTAVLRAVLSPPDLLDRLSETHVLFPLGIDLILVAGDAITAIPRSTRFASKEG